MKPGYDITTIVGNSTTTSTSYAFSNIIDTGQHNQMCVSVHSSLGAGLTSAEYKFQQSTTNDPAGEWIDYPILNISTLTTSTDSPPEYYITPKSMTMSMTASAGVMQRLGPFILVVHRPFFRVAYKANGVGTLTFKVEVSKIIV